MKHGALVISVFLLVLLQSVPAIAVKKHPAEVTQVTAVGEALAKDGNARDEAISDALRNAVMTGIGAYVESTTIGENYQVIEDSILVKANGFATLDDVISSSVSDGMLHVKIKASVSNKPLANRLKELGLTREWKVGVYLRGSDSSATSAETSITQALMKAGFRVIDESRRKQLLDDDLAAKAVNGDASALAAIKREYDVDIFITGDASAEDVDRSEEGGVMMYRSRGTVEARAYYTDTAEVLTVRDATGDGIDQTQNLAAKQCMKSTGIKLGSILSEDIMIAPAAVTPFMTVKIGNFPSMTTAGNFEKAMKSMPGVTQVKRQRYSGGMLELNVYVKGNYRDSLPEKIEGSKIGRKLGITINTWSKTFVQGRLGRQL